MAWGSDTAATQLTSITTEQFFDQVPTLNPRETAHVQVSVDFPSSPTDHAIVAVYTTLDDASEVWDLIPMMEFLIENTTDPNRISFLVTGRGAQIRIHGHDRQRRHEPAQGRRQRVIRHVGLASLAQAAAVADPARHRRSGRALGLAHEASLHPASVGARQRASGAAVWPSRANAQDDKDVKAEHRRRGYANSLRPRCQHSHGQRGRDRGTCRQHSRLRRLGAERALHDRSADQGSIWRRIDQDLYGSGTSSTGDHILFLTSGTTPNLRHQASGGGTVSITSSVAIVNDTTWSTIVVTWRPGRLELYVDGFSRASSTAAATNISALSGIYRWGWASRRHRTSTATSR